VRVDADQSNVFRKESFRYVSSSLDDPVRSDPFPESLPKYGIDRMLDVGCGNGNFLKQWAEEFHVSRAVGIEPSDEACDLLEIKHANSELIFEQGSIEKLQYENDTFDLVTAWSVLHWVGRNNFLQALGEMIRVTSKYLVVMDFVANIDYRVPYKHWEGLYTYHVDFSAPILASGIMKPIEEQRWWLNPETDTTESLSKSQVAKCGESNLMYHARKMVVFEKDYDRLPIFSEDYLG
jgi:ubiquinone/menaquinone biosynthesis C-methylase UbiE